MLLEQENPQSSIHIQVILKGFGKILQTNQKYMFKVKM